MSHHTGKRVLASGVFDILHPGHVHYLTEAKKLGDHLVVVITSDEHTKRTKRPPMHTAAERAALVAALAPVDEVFIGAEPHDLIATTRQANPDIIALGHDQDFDERELTQTLANAGIDVQVIRLGKATGDHSTSKIKSSGDA